MNESGSLALVLCCQVELAPSQFAKPVDHLAVVRVGQSAGMISQTKGSIGYIELVYAVQSNMPFASLKNASGAYIVPSLASSAAAAAVSLPNDLRVVIVNSPGADAYPISAFTWILVYKEQNYAGRTLAQAQALGKLLTWMLTDGQSINEGLSYARLPAPAVTKALALVSSMTYGDTAIP